MSVSKEVMAAFRMMAFLLSASPTAHAGEITCTGSLGPITVDNLRIPRFATCTLDGTSIKGTLKVERAATLNASGIRVNGDIQAESAASVDVSDSEVGGSILLAPPTGKATRPPGCIDHTTQPKHNDVTLSTFQACSIWRYPTAADP